MQKITQQAFRLTGIYNKNELHRNSIFYRASRRLGNERIITMERKSQETEDAWE